jgi:hypothetical protein
MHFRTKLRVEVEVKLVIERRRRSMKIIPPPLNCYCVFLSCLVEVSSISSNFCMFRFFLPEFMLKYVDVYGGIGDLRVSSHALCR